MFIDNCAVEHAAHLLCDTKWLVVFMFGLSDEQQIDFQNSQYTTGNLIVRYSISQSFWIIQRYRQYKLFFSFHLLFILTQRQIFRILDFLRYFNINNSVIFKRNHVFIFEQSETFKFMKMFYALFKKYIYPNYKHGKVNLCVNRNTGEEQTEI